MLGAPFKKFIHPDNGKNDNIPKLWQETFRKKDRKIKRKKRLFRAFYLSSLAYGVVVAGTTGAAGAAGAGATTGAGAFTVISVKLVPATSTCMPFRTPFSCHLA